MPIPLSERWSRQTVVAATLSLRQAVAFLLLLVLAVAPLGAAADKDSHTYKDGEDVVVWTDKVGPYNNPQETYKYDSLGLCELAGLDGAHIHDKDKVVQGDLSIGESLEGHEFFSSPRLKILFGKNQPVIKVCNMVLSAGQATSLKSMVGENYWYQLYTDDLPIWAFLGEHSKFGVDLGRFSRILSNKTMGAPAPTVPPEKRGKRGDIQARIYTHRHFTFFMNGNQVIEVDMEPSNPWPVHEGAQLNFTYSTVWYNTNKPFVDRHQRYLDPKFFEHKVHWFSIVNSFMLCLFLCAVVAIILMKTLKRDFTRYSISEADELESMDAGDDSGWKQVNGDVFRRPERLAVFASCHATGCHLACAVFFVLVFAIPNSYYAQRGATLTSFVISYLCTVLVGGFEGGRVFRMFGGQQWKRAMAYQCLTMPTIVFICFAMINTTAIVYRSTMTVPFRTIAIVMLLFIVLAVPLHMAGSLLGRRSAGQSSFPCRVHHLKRPIPTKHWAFLPAMIATAGVVPFGCLFIEMYFILSAVWSHNKVYYVYGFMLAILLLLLLVLVCVSITCVYVLLNAEDYRWAWQSFFCCGATSIYVFVYTIYYYYNSTQMSGFLQWIYYFATSLTFCIGLGLFCGSMGFLGASKFVFLIYGNIKAE